VTRLLSGFSWGPPRAPLGDRICAMALVVTGTAGLALWIVLWALNVSGFDGILIAISMVLVVTGIRNVVPYLTGRKDR
jgi:hypothetical protein